jgi:proteasome activator subunit 4
MQIDWNVPSERQVAFAMRLLREVVEPCVVFLEELVGPDADRSSKDDYFANDLSRHLSIIRYALSTTGTLVLIREPKKPGQSIIDSDELSLSFLTFLSHLLNSHSFYFNDRVMSFIDQDIACETGIILKDPEDPRYQYVCSLRERIGLILHRAVERLTISDTEDAIDSVRTVMYVSCLYYQCLPVANVVGTNQAIPSIRFNLIIRLTRRHTIVRLKKSVEACSNVDELYFQISRSLTSM